VRKTGDRTVVVLGASPKPVRYSYQAVKLLHEKGFRVIPVHPRAQRIEHLPVVHSLTAVTEPVDTLTLYIGPERVQSQVQAIVDLKPGRVILNPGAESHALELALRNARIPFEHACTLVLLRTGQF
jgi:predicted CoA-binding protein